MDDFFELLLNVPIKFWTCPVCERPRVEWNGDIATCMECKRTNKDPLEQQKE